MTVGKEELENLRKEVLEGNNKTQFILKENMAVMGQVSAAVQDSSRAIRDIGEALKSRDAQVELMKADIERENQEKVRLEKSLKELGQKHSAYSKEVWTTINALKEEVIAPMKEDIRELQTNDGRNTKIAERVLMAIIITILSGINLFQVAK